MGRASAGTPLHAHLGAGRAVRGAAARQPHRPLPPGQVERLARYHGDKARWVLDAWIGSWLHPGFASWTLAEVLPRVACPVLALHGALDE